MLKPHTPTDRLLFVNHGAFGDQLIALPILQELQRQYLVTYLGRPPALEVLREYLGIESHSLDSQAGFALYSNPAQMQPARIISVGRYDHAGAIPMAILDTQSNQHEIPKWLEWCQQLHLDFEWPGLTKNSINHRSLLLAPGSGSAKKNWPLDYFMQLSSLCPANVDIQWLLGPVEMENGLLTQLQNGINRGRLLKSPSAKILMDLFSADPVFIGNDSGLSHLAGLYNCRGLVIFQNSNAEVWRPWGHRLTILGSQYDPPSFSTVAREFSSLWNPPSH